MSSRPVFAPLSAGDEAKVARALAHGPGPGVPFQTEVKLGRRTLCVDAVVWPEGDDARLRFEATVSRRAHAEPYRLLPVAAAGEHDGCHWVAYEIGSALSLDSERGRVWEAEPCLDLLSDVAQGLDEAAAEGLLPYELGPGSIFFDPRFGVLIGDLGTAREAFGNPSVEDGLRATYVPPEVLRGEGPGERSGVYVCGALLYELLAGAPPRPGPLTQWRPDLSDAIDVVMARALARDWLERYASVAELCQSARRALLDTESAQPEPAPDSDTAAPFFFDDADEAFALAAAPAATPAEPPAEADAPFHFEDDHETFALAAASAAPPDEALADGDGALRFKDDDATAFELAAAPTPFEYVSPWELRFGRPWLVAATIVAALALGAVIGVFIARSGDDPAPTRAEHLGADGMSITLPTGWAGGVDDRAALSAYPSADGFSGLTVNREEGDIPADQRTDPVRLGRLDAWRDASEAPATVRYVAPTTTGKLVITCEASPGAARITLRVCERAASTLRLGTIQAVPLPGVVDEPGVRAAVGRLSAERAAARRRLGRARRPGGQRDVAEALARTHERAARRLARVPEAAPIAAAARTAADAYRALARAAGSESTQRWTAARESVRRADRALAEAIDQHSTG